MPKLDALLTAYTATTKRRIFRKLRVSERAGRFLSETAGPQKALVASLKAGDLDAALALADALGVADEIPPSPDRPVTASGEIIVAA